MLKENIFVTHNYNKATKTLLNQKTRLQNSQTSIINYGKTNKKKFTLINKLKSMVIKKPKYQNKTLSENTVLKYGLAKEILSKLNSNEYDNNFIKSIIPENKYEIFEEYEKELNNVDANKSKKKELVKNVLHSLLLSNFNESTKQRLLGVLKPKKSLTETQLNQNNFKQNFLKKYKEKMASGEFNNNILRFVSTTDNQHKRLEKIKKLLNSATSKDETRNKMLSLFERSKHELNMVLGLPHTIIKKNEKTI